MSSKKLFVFDSTRHPYEGFYKEATEQDLLQNDIVTRLINLNYKESAKIQNKLWIKNLKELESYHRTIEGQRFIAWGLIEKLIKEVSKNGSL